MILRESIRHEQLAKQILESHSFWKFFDYVELSTFDIASDAFASFKDLLTRHKALVAKFIESNYDAVKDGLTLVLCQVHAVAEFQQLCHQASIPETTGWTAARQNQFQRHDTVHFQSRESQAHDESVERKVSQHSIRSLSCIQDICS